MVPQKFLQIWRGLTNDATPARRAWAGVGCVLVPDVGSGHGMEAVAAMGLRQARRRVGTGVGGGEHGVGWAPVWAGRGRDGRSPQLLRLTKACASRRSAMPSIKSFSIRPLRHDAGMALAP